MYFLRLLILCSICVSIQSTIIPQELEIRPFNIEDEAAHQYGQQRKGLNGLIKRLRFGGFSSGSRGGSRGGSSSGSSSGYRGGGSSSGSRGSGSSSGSRGSGSSSGSRGRGSGSRTGAGIGAGLGIGAAAGHRHRNNNSSETSSASSSRLSPHDLFGSPINIAIVLLLTLAYANI
ncbi:DEHA2E21582p [Debaryomyces hansenii CBS767]|jgi:hypothetical protein|uniref:DEHA2E21582p n=1 Tax=Debaryomyces hansenii (strain ATCC 36239 / CBS 767 / BCRC 21394 / JCM 1990 / NBRC 0083 / IGC 2968) TaxID=284592 RepID=Q6BNH9_DEBHA|nr:DEHA2E21582p [Debaryomyces hansenii CBS767]CAG88517.1 DEHA2E21582p [Debaryomyces hansenii CBS767]|eukprot:XP_460241.1 DEHA2E21582p [Debaryomyces hansenii CBS767]